MAVVPTSVTRALSRVATSATRTESGPPDTGNSSKSGLDDRLPPRRNVRVATRQASVLRLVAHWDRPMSLAACRPAPPAAFDPPRSRSHHLGRPCRLLAGGTDDSHASRLMEAGRMGDLVAALPPSPHRRGDAIAAQNAAQAYRSDDQHNHKGGHLGSPPLTPRSERACMDRRCARERLRRRAERLCSSGTCGRAS